LEEEVELSRVSLLVIKPTFLFLAYVPTNVCAAITMTLASHTIETSRNIER
jgi:cytochrome c biogenesis factor